MDLFQVVAIVVSLALTAVAVVLVTQAVRAILGVLRTGQPSTPRTENPVGRSVTMLKETFLHTRMLQWTWVGIMHWFVYAGFIVLSAAVFTAYFQLFDPEFQLPIIGHFVLYEWIGELLGLLSTVGIVFLIIYRQLHHPRREGRSSRFYRSTMWQAYFVEVMALLEGSAILFIRGAEYNLGKLGEDPGRYSRVHFPISSLFGDLLYPAAAGSRASIETIIIAIAVIKILLAMIWLIVIARNLTMGVAWHRFTAWPNIWFKREPSGRTALGAVKPLTSAGKAITLDDLDDLDEDSLLGVGSVEDFSWKNILDFTTCTECGRCQSQCPAWNTEKPLNPKLLITALRDATYAKAPYLQAAEGDRAALLEGNDTLTREVERPLVGNTGDGWFYMPEDGSAVIDPEVLWNCTSCGACVQQCPVDIEHVDHIMDMRRYAVLVESNFPAELNGLFKGLENKGNPWNMSSTARLDWTKGLDFEVKIVGAPSDEGGIESLDEVDWLFWVGCAGAYEDRAKKTTRAVAELLEMAGVSFGVLGNGETCTGDPARRAGNEFVFQGLAQQNVEVLTAAKAKKVVSTCAHCFNTLKNEYRDFGIELEVVHHTQLLNRLVREGKLTPVQEGEGAHKRSITYHDPCYIGRHNGVYTPPRELLQVLPGAEFVEMERNSERSFCCGAGGARMWMEEKTGSRINVNRTIEAVGTGADQIAVGCPFCRVMLSDGLTAQQAKGEAREEVEILDVAQLLLASVKGEMATKLAPGAAAPADAAAPAAAAGDVATKAEPEAGDETITEDTVTETADVGPLAKASGNSSLFDDAPAESATAAPQASVPAEAAPTSGGSLFDTPGVEPAAEKKPAPVKTEPKAAPVAARGGSLFGFAAPVTPEVEQQAPASAVEAPAPEAAPEPDPEKPPTSSAPTSSPAASIPETGSLFDIEAPATPEVEQQAPASAVETPDGAPEPDPEKPPTSSAPAPSPAASIPETGSLFDIEAPATPEVEQQAPASSVEAPGADADPEPPETESPVGGLSAGAEISALATAAASDDPTPEPAEKSAAEATATITVTGPEAGTEGEEDGAVEPEKEPEEPLAEEKPKPVGSREAHQPKTDVDISGSGSLFDL